MEGKDSFLLPTMNISGDKSGAALEPVIIYLQDTEGNATIPLVTTSVDQPEATNQQFITLIQETEKASRPDDSEVMQLSAEDTSLFLDGTAGNEALSSLLSPLTLDESSPLEQRTGVLHSDDGQVLYVTYTLAPPDDQEDCGGGGEQQLVLQVSSEPLGGAQGGEVESEGIGGEVTDLDTFLALPPDGATSRRCRTQQILDEGMRIEDRLQVRDAMLPPVPARRCPERNSASHEGNYTCDLCGATFNRDAQYFGHLNLHSGERKWECAVCLEVFSTQSRLRRHENASHVSLRAHCCPSCPAAFNRASQLSYHVRRLHRGERTHICQVCSKAFFKRSDLRTHLNIHLGINKCICETCGQRFSHVSNLYRHTRSHSGVRPYPCSECGLRFNQLNALSRHKVSHCTLREVVCSVCTKTFKSHSDMRKHVRQHHREQLCGSSSDKQVLQLKDATHGRRFHCRMCGHSFQYLAELRGHEIAHMKEDKIHCGCCQKVFSNLDLLKTHSCRLPADGQDADLVVPDEAVATVEPAKVPTEQPEEEAESRLGEIIIYVALEDGHDPMQCENAPSLLMLPDNSLDGEPDPQPEVEDGNGKKGASNGDQFDSTTTSSLELQLSSLCGNGGFLATSHEQFMAGVEDRESDCDSANPAEVMPPPPLITAEHEDPPRPTPQPTPCRQIRLYHCPVCSKSFHKNSNYKQHLGMHYVDQQRYSCADCKLTFAWKSTFNKHNLAVHSGTPLPRFKCDLCSRDYASHAQVQEHVKRDHLKQRNHLCPVCEKGFFKKYDLKIHLRTHTKERPYICGTCGKAFYHLSHIIRHERIHSGLRPYCCVDCGRQFNQSSSLKMHRQRHVQCTTKNEPKEKNNLKDSLEV